MNNRLYSIQEAASILGVSTKTLRRWDQRGRLVATRTAGNQRRYTHEQIQELKVESGKLKNNSQLSTLNSQLSTSLPSVLSGLPSGSFLKNHFLLKHKEEIEFEESSEESSEPASPAKAGLNPVKMGFVVGMLVLFLSFAGAVILVKYNVVAGLSEKRDQFAKFINNLPQISFEIRDPSQNSGQARELGFVPPDLVGSVLAAAAGGADIALNVNIPAFFSQNVGIGTATPDTSAILDLVSEDKGFLAPRMTEVQLEAITTPAAGLFVYNTDTNHYNMYNGTSWVGVFTAIGDSTTGEAFTETGTSGTALYFFDADGRGQLTIANLTGARKYTLPDAEGEISLLGQTISNAELVNSKVTVSPGTNMTGGGEVALGSSVTITLKDSVALAGTLTVSGATTLSGDLAVNGADITTTATTFNLVNATATTLNIGGAATTVSIGAATGTVTLNNATTAITGALTANGNVTLGDAITDTITFTGRVAQDSDLIPIGTTGTNDLGSSSLPWDNIYADNVFAASSGTSGYWQRNSSALSPTNITDDVLIGATATSSALIKLTGTNVAGANNSWFNAGNVGIGDTSPDYLLELSDATNTPAFALSDDDIAHGVTDVVQTDVFAHLSSISSTVGGAYLQGLADASGVALQFRGIQSSDPTDTTPAISVIGAKASGTGVQDLAAAETVFQVANNDDTAALTILGSGNIGIATTTPATFKLEIAGIIGPSVGSTYDIGSSARRFATIYADTGNFTNIAGVITGGSTTSADWLINSDNTTEDAQDATLTFERGTPATNSQFRWDSTTKQLSTNTPSFAILPDSTIAYSGTSALMVNQIQAQDIFTASASGTTRFTIENDGDTVIAGDLAVNGGDITTTETTFNLVNATATTLNIGGAATTALNIGNGNTAYTAINIGSGTGGNTINIAGTGATGADTVNIATGGTSADTVNIGSSASTTAVNVTTGTGAQTYTSNVATGATTTSGFVFDATAITSGTGIYAVTDSVTTGRLLDIATSGNTWTGNGTTNGLINIASTSTAGTASSQSILLNLARSGANANTAHTAYGVYSAVTNTNATSGTNIAGYFSASGATTANYGLIVANGNVGIGDTTPAALFVVGDGDDFQIDSTGDITLNQTTPNIAIGNTGTLTVTDGTNILFSIADDTAEGDVTVTGDLAVNGATSADITTTTTTASLFNATATTLNIGGAATTIGVGAAASATTWTGQSFSLTGANSTNNTTLTVQNTSNTVATSENAIVDIAVGGVNTTGDPQLRLTVPGGTSWYMGVDNSLNDDLFIGDGTTVGGGHRIRITSQSNNHGWNFIPSVRTTNSANMPSHHNIAISGRTLTINDQVGVTGLMAGFSSGSNTINQSSSLAVTVDKYTGVQSTGATAGTNVSITHSSAFRALTGGAAVNASGYYAEAQTAGTTGNYQALFAVSTGASPALADHVGINAKDFGVGDTRLYIQAEAGSYIALGNDRLTFEAATAYFQVSAADELTLTATALSPSTNDGNALGTTTLGWSDLHLATGGVINWANGEVTITETDADTLTIAGTTLIDVAAGILELNNAARFDTGVATVATAYSVGRNADDGTNLLQLNVPTGASFELSVNDVAQMTLSATAVDFQDNSITTTGGGSLTGTWTDLGSVTTIDINGGTIDGVTIGGAAAGAITGTTIDATTDFTIGGTVITDGAITDTGVFVITPTSAISLGSGEAGTTAATGMTLRAPDITTGGLGNIAGADLILAAGLGTGTGDAGIIDFQLPIVAGAGDFIQTRASRLVMDMAGSSTDLTFAFQQATTVSTTTGNLTLYAATDADVLIGDGAALLNVDGGVPGIFFNGNYVEQTNSGYVTSGQIYLGSTWGRTFTGSGSVDPAQFRITGAMTVTATKSGYGLLLQPGLTEAGSGNHALLANLYVDQVTPVVGNATVTDTASLYIANAMSATVTGANYALWVDAGTARFDDALILGADGTAPAGTNVYAVRDNTGDLTLNALTGKTINLAINGTDVAQMSATTLAFQQATTISTTTGDLTINSAGQVIFPDDDVVNLGTSQDIAMVLNSAGVAANTTLTDVLIGTPVTAVSPANSLLTSNITVSGDMAWYLNDGAGNSWEYLRFDGSADLTVFNEAGSDIDFRIEGVGAANAFFVQGSNGNVGIGTATPLLRLDVAGSARATGTATSVLTGSIDATASTAVVGVGTLFTTELVVGDRITLNDGVNPAETRTVTAITNNLNLTVSTAFTDLGNDTTPDKLAAEFIVRDSSNNVDFIVQDLGNVGIGTEAPNTKLDVRGTHLHVHSGTDVLAGNAFNFILSNSDTTPFGTDASGMALRNSDSTTDNNYFYLSFQGDNTNGGRFHGAGLAVIFKSHSLTDYSTDLALYTHATGTAAKPLERMRITSTGNIGIGTTAPDAALEINHATGDSLRLTYNDADGSAVNYTDFSLDADGTMTVLSSAKSIASGTDSGIIFDSGDLTITGASTSWLQNQFLKADVTAATALTIDNAATVYINDAPDDIGAGPATITNKYALWVDAGNVQFDGGLTVDGDTLIGAAYTGDANRLTVSEDTLTTTSEANAIMALQGNTDKLIVFHEDGVLEGAIGYKHADSSLYSVLIYPPNSGSALPSYIARFNRTDAQTVDSNAASITFAPVLREAASGTHAIFDGILVNALSVTAGVAGVTEASTMRIAGASNASGATNYALWVDAGTSRFDGAVTYGSQVTFTDSDATPDVSAGSHFITNTTTFTITDFDAGAGTLQAGHIIYVESNGAITYDCTPFANLNCGGADIVTAAKDITSWIYDGTDWTLINWMDTSVNQTGADIAELFPSQEQLEPGDVVVADTGYPVNVRKSATVYEKQLLGIVSTQPAITLGQGIEGNNYPVALTGRVPVKVSLENGPIAIGDPITSSSTPGVGMKSTKAGRVIGIALEQFNNETIGTILAFVNPHWQGTDKLLALDGNDRLGIGTTTPSFKLDIQDMQIATAAAQIFNTDTGTSSAALVLKLGNTSADAVASTNHFISFETAGIGIVGSISGNGAKGVTYATSGVADFAEYFRKDPNENIPFGSIVCMKEDGLVTSCEILKQVQDDTRKDKILGIASEAPAFLGGINLGASSIAVGLVGQVETFVSSVNGDIKPGDPLTLGSTPGVAVKAIKAGQIIGKAVEAFPEDGRQSTEDGTQKTEGTDTDNPSSVISNPSSVVRPLSSAIGKILVSVNVGWYDPSIYIASDGTLGGVQNTQNTQQAGESDISDSQTIGSTDLPSVSSSLENDSLFKELKDKVGSLESKLDLLSLQFEQQASTSGLLAQIGEGQVLAASDSASLVQSLGDVELNNATISEDLMVLGRATVTSLGVTGNINAGLLAIHGIDGEINTLSGDLYLQKDSLGGINIFDGRIVMDTKGNMTVAGTITAKQIEAENYTILGEESIGSSTIPAGSTSIEVTTQVASSSSKIFLSATSLTDKQITVVEKSDGKFKVAIPQPTASPISFDWWIVGNRN